MTACLRYILMLFNQLALSLMFLSLRYNNTYDFPYTLDIRSLQRPQVLAIALLSHMCNHQFLTELIDLW